MIGALIDALWGPLGAALGGLVAMVAGIVAVRRSAAQKAENERLRADKATRERIDDATQEHLGDDPAALRDFLRERGKR